jgi:hypothetical protein
MSEASEVTTKKLVIKFLKVGFRGHRRHSWRGNTSIFRRSAAPEVGNTPGISPGRVCITRMQYY